MDIDSLKAAIRQEMQDEDMARVKGILKSRYASLQDAERKLESEKKAIADLEARIAECILAGTLHTVF